MASVKIVKSGYKDSQQMRNLIDYVLSDTRHQNDGLLGGEGVFVGDADSVCGQMMDVKQQYGKTRGLMMRHVIISFSDYELQFLDRNKIYAIAQEACGLFRRYQTVFGIHLETGRAHIHIAVNTVSFVDGRKLQMQKNASGFRKDVDDIIASYVPKPLFNGAPKSECTTATLDGWDGVSSASMN